MFDWFNAKQASEFGKQLAQFLEQEMPDEIGKKKEKTLAKRKRVLTQILVKVHTFKQTNKLNYYKKAKLANAFKWYLIDAGYDPEFIEEITNIIVTQL